MVTPDRLEYGAITGVLDSAMNTMRADIASRARSREFPNRFEEKVLRTSMDWFDPIRIRTGEDSTARLAGRMGMSLDVLKAPELIFLYKSISKRPIPNTSAEFFRALQSRLEQDQAGKSIPEILLAETVGEGPSTLWLAVSLLDVIQEGFGYHNLTDYDEVIRNGPIKGRRSLIALLLGNTLKAYMKPSSLDMLVRLQENEVARMQQRHHQ